MNPLILLLRMGRMLPPAAAWRLGQLAGSWFALLGGREPRRALAHLQRAFPQASAAWHYRTMRGSFAHCGGMALWTWTAVGKDPRRVAAQVQVEGGEALRAMLRESRQGSRGTVAFTGHFGNWELLARVIAVCAPATVVGRRLRMHWLDEAVKWLRTDTGARQVDQQAGVRPLLQDLRAGRIIGCLADQDVPALSGVFVPWFGHAAYTPNGPALLAAMAPHTAIQVVVCLRRHGRWLIHSGPRWSWPDGPRQEQALRMTARATAYLESLVRQYPQQWVWWHKRWRTQPAQRPQAASWPPSESP